MKNILYTIVAFLASPIIYGQDFEYLKKSDTIYIEFKDRKNEKKDIIHSQITSNNFIERAYDFNLFDENNLYFQYSTFKNWEKKEDNIISEIRKVNKSFLKKHKKEIVRIDSLKKYKYNDIVCELFSQLKVLYIIDFTEKKKGNVILYEVNCLNYCPSIE
jgi:hypothetical protein